MTAPIKAWSYTSYRTFKNCQFAWKKRFIDKVKPVGFNPALQRGTEIHAKAEYLLKGEIKGMPKELKNFSHEFKELMRLGAEAETDLSITEAMKPTHAKDWDGVWCRMKVDSRIILGEVSTIIDYKTGKKYGENEEQCSLYAVGEYIHHPEIKQVDTELWYLDIAVDNVELHSYTVREIKALMRDWKKRVAPMFKEQKQYAPNPCFMCKFCDHASDKGGDCPYDSKGRKL